MEKFPGFNPDPDIPPQKPEKLLSNPGQDDLFEDIEGREINGLEPTPEKFTRLHEPDDYTVMATNERITSEDSPQNHVLFINPSQGDVTLTITPPHWRTITEPSLGSLVRENGTSEHFFEVNTKGVGYLKPTVKGGDFDILDTWVGTSHIEGERIVGICSAQTGHKSPESLMKLSNRMIDAGLRTEAHWMIASLNRIPFKGELTELTELQEKNVIPRKFSDRNLLINPIEVVRLLKTNTRIEEAYEAEDRRNEIFAEAFTTYNKEAQLLNQQELVMGNKNDERIFFQKFSERTGGNMATLLNNGMSHFYLHSSNISMAAEFLDLEPLEHWTRMTKSSGWKDEHNGLRLQHIKDMRDAVQSLRRLFKAARMEGLHTGKRKELAANLIEGFDATFDPIQAKEQEIDEDWAKSWFAAIAKHLLVDRENLPSLGTHDISEWDIPR